MGIYDAITQNARMTEAQVQNRMLDAQMKQHRLAEEQQHRLQADRQRIIEVPESMSEAHKRQTMREGTMAGMDMSLAGAGELDTTSPLDHVLGFGSGILDSALFGVPSAIGLEAPEGTEGAHTAGRWAGTAALIGASLVLPGIQTKAIKSAVATGKGTMGVLSKKQAHSLMEGKRAASKAVRESTKALEGAQKTVRKLETLDPRDVVTSAFRKEHAATTRNVSDKIQALRSKKVALEKRWMSEVDKLPPKVKNLVPKEKLAKLSENLPSDPQIIRGNLMRALEGEQQTKLLRTLQGLHHKNRPAYNQLMDRLGRIKGYEQELGRINQSRSGLNRVIGALEQGRTRMGAVSKAELATDKLRAAIPGKIDAMQSKIRTLGTELTTRQRMDAEYLSEALVRTDRGVLDKILTVLGKKGAPAGKAIFKKGAVEEVQTELRKGLTSTVKNELMSTINRMKQEIGVDSTALLLWQIAGTAQPVAGAIGATQQQSLPRGQDPSSPYYIDPNWHDMMQLQGLGAEGR